MQIIQYAPYAILLAAVVIIIGLVIFLVLRKQNFQGGHLATAYKAVVTGLNDSIIILDTESRILDLNSAAEETLNLTKEQAAGQPIVSLLPQHKELIDHYAQTAEVHNEIVVGNGPKNRSFELSISPLMDQRGKNMGRVVVLHDITQRKKTEEELARARDQAVTSNLNKSEMLSRISHELRTPLGVIRGYADLLSAPGVGTLTEVQTKAVQEITDSTDRLAEMVDELLDHARIEAGAVKLESNPFSPADLLTKLQEKMSVLAKKKGLTLVTNITPEVPTQLMGDPTRITQILTNLTSNAIKFTKVGEVRVNIFSQNAHQWVIEVTDNGPGIPEEAQKSIFEPFHQADRTIARRYGGSGLGLAIVKLLTDMMGGEVKLSSVVGEGSTFTVALPIEKESK